MKKPRRGTSGMKHGKAVPQRHKGRQPADPIDIPVDPTRATVPIPGLKAGKRKT